MNNLEVLDVYLNDELVGSLTLLPQDRIIFNFSENYIHNKNRPVLSQSFYDQQKQLIL